MCELCQLFNSTTISMNKVDFGEKRFLFPTGAGAGAHDAVGHNGNVPKQKRVAKQHCPAGGLAGLMS